MSLQRDLAILIGAAVAVFVVGTSISMMPKTPVAPKAKPLAVAPAPEPKAEPIVPTPIATVSVQPVELKPAAELPKPAVQSPPKRITKIKRKPRPRLIARVKDPCVGPLCSLVR